MCKCRNSINPAIFFCESDSNEGKHRGKIRLDGCLHGLIHYLNMHGTYTLGSCCGHGKYNMSIVYRLPNGKICDLVSSIEIPRRKRFYVKDKEGFYFIPEVVRKLK